MLFVCGCLCVLEYVFEGLFECTHKNIPLNIHTQTRKFRMTKSRVTKSRDDEKSWWTNVVVVTKSRGDEKSLGRKVEVAW